MHPTYIQFASHLIYTKKLWIYGSTIRPPHTYKTHIHTYEKKNILRKTCDCFCIHPPNVDCCLLLSKKKELRYIHTLLNSVTLTPNLLTATTCVFSHHKYFFAKLNKPAIYFLKFNPLWSYVSSIAHAMCRNDGFLLQPNKDRCLFQDILKWTFKTVLSSSILKNR